MKEFQIVRHNGDLHVICSSSWESLRELGPLISKARAEGLKRKELLRSYNFRIGQMVDFGEEKSGVIQGIEDNTVKLYRDDSPYAHFAAIEDIKPASTPASDDRSELISGDSVRFEGGKVVVIERINPGFDLYRVKDSSGVCVFIERYLLRTEPKGAASPVPPVGRQGTQCPVGPEGPSASPIPDNPSPEFVVGQIPPTPMPFTIDSNQAQMLSKEMLVDSDPRMMTMRADCAFKVDEEVMHTFSNSKAMIEKVLPESEYIIARLMGFNKTVHGPFSDFKKIIPEVNFEPEKLLIKLYNLDPKMGVLFRIFDLSDADAFHRASNSVTVGECKVCRYTKMFDNQGVSIFEGDIVKVEGSETPLVVQFTSHTPSGVGFFVSRTIIACPFEFASPMHSSDLSLDKVKIIGNAYQNPELLQ